MSSQVRSFKDASDIRLQGNNHFKKQDFREAIKCYSESISILQAMQTDNGVNVNNISKQDIIRDELMLALTNRAEARIRLRHFEAALGDATRALKIQPHHLKSLYRKGKALRALHCYKDSVDCFELALSFDPNNEELKKELDIGQEFYLQCSTGKYDLLSLCKLEASDGKDISICGEYVGPVTIAASEEGKGRGLFLTKDVKCGELLLVSNAVNVVVEATSNYTSAKHISNMGLMSLSTHRVALGKLLDKIRYSERLRKQIYSLAHDVENSMHECDNIPDIELFSPGIYVANLYDSEDYDLSVNSTAVVSMDRVSSVLRLNSFQHGKSSNSTALFLLPSFVNHSCVPNSSFMFLGTAMFVRTARNIKKGEEVTISYVNPLQPYRLRHESLSKPWGFECKCQRCLFEGTVGSRISHLQAMVISVDQRVRRMDMNEGIDAKVCAELEDVLKHLVDYNGATQQQVDWLRTSFTDCYLTTYMHLIMPTQNKGNIPPVDTFVTSVKDTIGTCEALLFAEEALSLAAGKFSGHCVKSLNNCICEMECAMYGVQSRHQIRAILSARKMYFVM